ncbi:MAG: flagellar export chaperone FlgN [Desulfarculus sp.]|nr:flagellar export chaperone FlgN [Desulfarculus sp.]
MNSDVQEIRERIEEEIGCYRELMAVVEQERGVLLSGRHEGLLACAEQKLMLAQRLAKVQEMRRLAMARISPDPEHPLRLRDLGEMLPAEERGPYRTMLVKAQALAERLAMASASNKAFVEEALDTVEHLLGILAGQGRPQAYDASGAMGARLGPAAPRMLAREV